MRKTLLSFVCRLHASVMRFPGHSQPINGSRHVQGLAKALTVFLPFPCALVQVLATQEQLARFLVMPAESCQPSA